MKKYLAMLLALCMLLCLTACGETKTNPAAQNNAGAAGDGAGTTEPTPEPVPETFETRIARADKAMQDVKSFQMDMGMDMRMSLAILGESADIDMHITMQGDTENNPLKSAIEMEMDVNAAGQSQNQKILTYILQDGSQYVTYSSSDEGKTWQKEIKDSPEGLQQNPEENMEMFMACADSFQESGKETIGGVSAIVYKGELQGDFVQQAMESSGALDSVGELLGGDASAELFKDLDPIPVTVAFDEQSGVMVYYEMDMTSAMSTMMQRMMESLLQTYGMDKESAGLEINATQVKISVTLSRFDQVTVTIPESVTNS
jgi:hypothetical protein